MLYLIIAAVNAGGAKKIKK